MQKVPMPAAIAGFVQAFIGALLGKPSLRGVRMAGRLPPHNRSAPYKGRRYSDASTRSHPMRGRPDWGRKLNSAI